MTFDPRADLPGARSGGHTSESVVRVRGAYRHGERRDLKIREAKVLFLQYGLTVVNLQLDLQFYHYGVLSKE